MRASRVSLSPATPDDIGPFFETTPLYRMQAWVAKVDGEAVGLGGVYFLEDGTRVGFIELTEAGYAYPRELILATHKFLQMLRDDGVMRVIAVADPGIEASERFMKHFGFTNEGRLNDNSVYVWKSK